MPFVHVFTNVSKANADVAAVHSALSKALSVSLGRPEEVIMTIVDFDQSMQVAKSDAPTAYVHVRSINRTDKADNIKTAKELTDTVASQLDMSVDRVSVIIKDVPNTNWLAGGKLLTNITD